MYQSLEVKERGERCQSFSQKKKEADIFLGPSDKLTFWLRSMMRPCEGLVPVDPHQCHAAYPFRG